MIKNRQLTLFQGYLGKLLYGYPVIPPRSNMNSNEEFYLAKFETETFFLSTQPTG